MNINSDKSLELPWILCAFVVLITSCVTILLHYLLCYNFNSDLRTKLPNDFCSLNPTFENLSHENFWIFSCMDCRNLASPSSGLIFSDYAKTLTISTRVEVNSRDKDVLIRYQYQDHPHFADVTILCKKSLVLGQKMNLFSNQ